MTTNPLARDLDDILAATSPLFEELRGRRIFITGATGFFGCWLLESFVWANEKLDLHAKATILTRDPKKFERRLPHLMDCGIEVMTWDIRGHVFPNDEFSHVIHATPDPDADAEGTQCCLDFAENSRADKFLLISSGAVYGKQSLGLANITENFTGIPETIYSEGKQNAERLSILTAERTSLEVKIARCFSFVGPYMRLHANFAIGNFIGDRLAGGPIRVQGDGTPIRSYLYASDLMIWLWTILFRGVSCRPYNVGSEDAISIAELAQEVAGPLPIEIVGNQVYGVSPRYVPSTQRAQKELGLRCIVPLSDAIERTAKWCMEPAQ